jgi:hypothetical protein
MYDIELFRMRVPVSPPRDFVSVRAPVPILEGWPKKASRAELATWSRRFIGFVNEVHNSPQLSYLESQQDLWKFLHLRTARPRQRSCDERGMQRQAMDLEGVISRTVG